MKNFKKLIFLSIIVIFIISYLIYNYIKESGEEFIVENVYLDINTDTIETNKIILHITGEVNKPRNYTDK